MGEFYQFVTAAVYHADGLWGDATWDLYLRELPPGVGYAVCAGVDEAVEAIEQWGFSDDTVAGLEAHPAFTRVNRTFFESLRHLRFSGDLWAIPEGSLVFPGEPILRITAPLTQCVLLETTLLQRLGFSIGVATRAARLVDAANGREVIDFSARRWSSPESAAAAARAAYIGGVTGTSNVAAVFRNGMEAGGTLSGSMLAVYGEERLALEALRVHFPAATHVVLPEEDPRDAIARLPPLKGAGALLRLQEPHLDRMARMCREALDARGLSNVRILGSGGLDEHRIAALVAQGVPVDTFGVARGLGIGVGEIAGQLSFRIAEMMRGPSVEPVVGRGAAPWPGTKQVIRYPHKDVICLESETGMFSRMGGVPLLHHVLQQGRRVGGPAPLVVARGLRAAQVGILPPKVRRLKDPTPYPVEPSDRLAALALG